MKNDKILMGLSEYELKILLYVLNDYIFRLNNDNKEGDSYFISQKKRDSERLRKKVSLKLNDINRKREE